MNSWVSFDFPRCQWCSASELRYETIWSYNTLEFHGMYPFVHIVNDSLILEWAANRANSAINETLAAIQRRTLLMDCIRICSQRGTGEEGLVKVSKVVAMFVVNPILNNISHQANFGDRSAKSCYHVTITTGVRKSFKKRANHFSPHEILLCILLRWNYLARILYSCRTETEDILTYLRRKEWQIHLILWFFWHSKPKVNLAFPLRST